VPWLHPRSGFPRRVPSFGGCSPHRPCRQNNCDCRLIKSNCWRDLPLGLCGQYPLPPGKEITSGRFQYCEWLAAPSRRGFSMVMVPRTHCKLACRFRERAVWNPQYRLKKGERIAPFASRLGCDAESQRGINTDNARACRDLPPARRDSQPVSWTAW
jgi:hypothetical protein